MRNIALKLMYNGTAYHGWQVQKTVSSVCETMEKGLSKVCGGNVKLVGCGRTDAGVHAERYIANFHTESRIPVERLPFAINTHTPEDIVVREALEVADDFNAILSCQKKEYTYRIYNSRIKNPFYVNRAYFYPKHLDEEAARRALDPRKDMDGITDGSLAAVYAGTDGGYPPCTAAACVALLKHYNIPIKGKRVVVIGRSLVIGKPVSLLLLAEHATVTICHSRSENLPEICREADILVVAAGKAGMVGAESVRVGQVVLDVGIHVGADGNLCGDTRFAEVEPVVEAITPVPGGVGTVTSTILASHVVEAAERAANQ